jgi:hypothetical protein
VKISDPNNVLCIFSDQIESIRLLVDQNDGAIYNVNDMSRSNSARSTTIGRSQSVSSAFRIGVNLGIRGSRQRR